MRNVAEMISGGLEKLADVELRKRSSIAMFGEVELPEALKAMDEEIELNVEE